MLVTGGAPRWIEGDVHDRAPLDRRFPCAHIAAMIRFARLHAVGGSVAEPLTDYDNNVRQADAGGGDASGRHQDRNLLSSATVYGEPDVSSIPEGAAHTKAV